MPKAGAHEVSDPPAIPTASKSQADAKGLSKPTSLRLTLFLSVAILVVAALGIFGALRHDAQLVQLSVKLEEQAAESTKIQRRMGRVAEKAAASNRSIKVLIEDLKEEKKELVKKKKPTTDTEKQKTKWQQPGDRGRPPLWAKEYDWY